MNEARDLVDFELSPPVTWAAIPLDDDLPQGWAVAITRSLCDTEPAAVDLARRLEHSVEWLVGDEPPALLAVWVPDRAVPAILGLLRVELMLAVRGQQLTRDFYRSITDPAPKRKGVQILDRVLADVDLPAGPALVTHERVSRRESRFGPQVVWENIIYTVFPPHCNRALQLKFGTDALDWAEAMARDAGAAAETLRVILAESS